MGSFEQLRHAPTLAVLAEGLPTQAPIQTPSQHFSGWMTKLALSVCYMTKTNSNCVLCNIIGGESSFTTYKKQGGS